MIRDLLPHVAAAGALPVQLARVVVLAPIAVQAKPAADIPSHGMESAPTIRSRQEVGCCHVRHRLGSGAMRTLGLGCLHESEVPGVLVVEASRHSAAELQPVLLELPHACLLLPGRAVCPALGTGGTVDTVACRKAARGKRQSQRSRPDWINRRPWAGSGAGLVGGVLAAGGWACQEPSGQIPPPWAWWENEAPTARGTAGSRLLARACASPGRSQ
jgi:hypothetical protein